MNNIFDIDLIEKYSTQGPRYTSYPTAVQFTETLDANRFSQLIRQSNASGKDLSLYAHIPFCDTLCYYCACNKVITKKHALTAPYLEHIEKEMQLVAKDLDTNRRVVQLHWGGGTPTFLTTEEQWELMGLFKKYFNFASDDEGEFSIEIDPRTVTTDSIKELRKMGFNRLSFGVQDFDEHVQVAINRIQGNDETRLIIEEGRKQGFHSISVDLIYGLPLQTTKSFERTLDKIIELSPDRIAVFNYAHLPHIFAVQRKIQESTLPSSQMKLRTLYRNFQGYSTFSECDLFGFGVSSISQVGDSYSQNVKDRKEYYRILETGTLPTVRGVELTNDDIIRRKVITEIMCNMKIDWNAISKEFSIDARKYFKKELPNLTPLHEDGLLILNDNGFEVTAPGRLLIRNIAMLFDIYLPQAGKKTFSKVI